jgi:predicted nucleic acid-binding protein
VKAIDAGVLLRLATRDDPREVAAAEAFIAGGAWVSHLVLAEAVAALAGAYSLAPAQIADAVGILLEHERLSLQEPDVVAAALGLFRENPEVSYGDCLVVEVARKAGHLPVGTLDSRVGALGGGSTLEGRILS